LRDGAYIALGSEEAVIIASARRAVLQLVPNGQERAVKQGDLVGQATGELSLKRTTAESVARDQATNQLVRHRSFALALGVSAS
jgi:hypothetical protein